MAGILIEESGDSPVWILVSSLLAIARRHSAPDARSKRGLRDRCDLRIEEHLDMFVGEIPWGVEQRSIPFGSSGSSIVVLGRAIVENCPIARHWWRALRRGDVPWCGGSALVSFRHGPFPNGQGSGPGTSDILPGQDHVWGLLVPSAVASLT